MGFIDQTIKQLTQIQTYPRHFKKCCHINLPIYKHANLRCNLDGNLLTEIISHSQALSFQHHSTHIMKIFKHTKDILEQP